MRIFVIGGGAAGFFAAINAAEKNKNAQITILEKTSRLLAKVLVSGGGRCNVTHACFDNSLLVKNYPRGEKELRGAFSKFSTRDTVEWFKKRGVTLKTEEDGRMFPVTDSSETIANCLLESACHAGVEVKTGVSVKEIIKSGNGFLLKTGMDEFSCDKLIIATGGSPKDENYNWLRKLGHGVIPPVPSLFTFNVPNDPVTRLMGISVPQAQVRIRNTKLETSGPLLVTHWGLSGPAVLKASAWGARILHALGYHFTAQISWLPLLGEEEAREILVSHKELYAAKLITNSQPFEFPKRLWEFFIHRAAIPDTQKWADTGKKQIHTLLEILLRDNYTVKGKTTFKEEFVTCGGIPLKEIDFGTMQSKIVPGLYFAGEVLDIDGITGGFNFQSAWTTGWIASQSV